MVTKAKCEAVLLFQNQLKFLLILQKKTTLDDMIVGIVKNTFKDKNDAQQFRIQLIQTANSKVQYFDRRSMAPLSFSPSSLQLPLNDNLKIGVGAFNLTKSQFSDFTKSFKSANDLILNVDMKGSMKGKLVFSLQRSSRALSFFNKNC